MPIPKNIWNNFFLLDIYSFKVWRKFETKINNYLNELKSNFTQKEGTQNWFIQSGLKCNVLFWMVLFGLVDI